MHVAIHASALTGAHSKRGTGIYAKNLIKALQANSSGHTYSFFTHTQDIHPLANIIHFPYFDPFFLTLPIYLPKPALVTVHDLIPLRFPKHFPRGIRGHVKWLIQRMSLRRKQRIITDSESSKTDISQIAGIQKEIIDVIYLAPSLQEGIKDPLCDIKKKFDIPSSFFLYVGDVNWNKNIPGLLHAFGLYKKHTSSDAVLLLVGRAFLDATLPETRRINEIIHNEGLDAWTIKTGFVSDETLRSLYSHTIGLLCPSFYEGFGFPVIDALSMGCPVVTSDASSLKEIAGPSIRIHPNEERSIFEGMAKLSKMNTNERASIIHEGKKWAKQYSWKKVAENTVKSYEKVLAGQ